LHGPREAFLRGGERYKFNMKGSRINRKRFLEKKNFHRNELVKVVGRQLVKK